MAAHQALRCSCVNAAFSPGPARAHCRLNALKSAGPGLPGRAIASDTAVDTGRPVPEASADSIRLAREVDAIALGEKEGRCTPVSGSVSSVRRLGSLVDTYGLSWSVSMANSLRGNICAAGDIAALQCSI